ncbi:hypothetical protein GCM10017562_01580 [Streptomyces roseofulvus]|uniref:hypothetical protein n=1 Tax=Streptomyces roseofulvus TaxID=33902 RepID=UPI0031F8E571
MTTHPIPSYARPLLLGLALLAAGTVVLLHGGPAGSGAAEDASRPPAVRTAPPAATAYRPATGPSATSRADGKGPATPGRTASVPAAAGPAASPVQGASDQPVSGDGPAGDHAIQRLLDRTAPTDLPPATARQLADLATRVWIAETTGNGRTAWPAYFTDTRLRAPYHDVRVQAAVAYSAAGEDDRAEVRLVWAGADAAGEFRDGRTARVLLEHHHNEWQPVR